MRSAVLSLTLMKPGVVEVSVQPPGGRQVSWGHHGKGCKGTVPQELGPGTANRGRCHDRGVMPAMEAGRCSLWPVAGTISWLPSPEEMAWS